MISTDIFAQEVTEKFGRGEMSRILKMLDIVAGKLPVPTAPMQQVEMPVFFPDITNEPWPSLMLPWMNHLEDNYDVVRDELNGLLAEGHPLAPYSRAYASASDDPTKTDTTVLDGWNAFYFYRDGQRIDQHCEMCPRTAEILKSVPLVWEGFFSALKAGKHIPEHSDDLNFALTCHMGLKVPAGCSIRVGSETRPWVQGKTILFNSSFLHEAWNQSDEDRIVLLVDAWHPELTPVEIEAMTFLLPKLKTALGLTPNMAVD